MSYLNFPRKGYPRGMKICVWTHLGLIKWKTTSKKIRNGRRPQKKKEDDLKKRKKEDDLKKKYRKKIKTTLQKEMEDDPPKNEKWKTTSKQNI